MQNISTLLVKLGILAIPQIMLLWLSPSVKAGLVNDIQNDLNDLKVKQQESSTDQSATTSTQIANPIANPKNTDQKDQSPNTEKVADTVKVSQPVVKTANTAEQTASRILILSPTVGTALDSPTATVVIQMPSSIQIELLVNGKAVNPNLIGRSEVDETNKTVTQTWYGVPLQAGDNQINARAIGSELDTTSINLKVRGAPVKLVVSTLESRIPADGRSFATVDGQLVDESGNLSNWDALLTLEASSGEFIGTDASPEQPGFQVQAKQGKFTAQLRSSLNTGTATIRAVTAQMEAFTQVQFETDLRPSLVTGVIDLRVGARGTDFYRSLREFLPADRNNRTQVDLYGAVFGTGRVGEWLFTGAFNNSRTLSQDCAGNSSLSGSARYCDPQYPTYGDSSTVTQTTPSYDSLYLRFERNSPVQGASTDYFMWGNYNTEEFAGRSQQFSAISRQLQGFKGNFNLGDLQITGFYSNIGKGFQRDTIVPNGTSGTYFLSKRLLINGSENVAIESVDFFSPGTLISRTELVRGKDYDINYDNGSILFRQPLFQTELGDVGQLLRRQIVVTYQNDQIGGDNSNIYGGQLRYHLNRSQSQPSWIAANYFQESLGIRNFILYGANALISFGEKTQLIAEYARSQNDSELLGFVTGTAMRFELNSEIASGILGKLYYKKAETGFANNATISFIPGQTRYGAELSAKVGSSTSLQFRYDQEDNLGIAPRPLRTLADLLTPRQEAVPGSAVDNSLRTISVGLQQNIGVVLLNLDLLYRDRQDRQAPNFLTSNSTQLRSRLTVPIANNLTFNAQNELSLSSSADAVIPDRSILSLDWTIVEGLTARLGQQWFQSGPLAGNSITSADLLGDYKFGSDTNITGRYSVIGGNSTTSTQGSLGLNQRWQVLSGLRLNFGYEHTFGSFTTIAPTGQTFLQPFAVGQSSSSLTSQNGNSYNIGAEYTDNPDLKASARYEHRSSNTDSNTVFTASALGKLSPALTMLFNYQQSSAANQLIVGLGAISNLKVGLAYRNPEDDKFNLLLRYEYRQNPSIVPESLLLSSGSGYTDYTLALEGIYAPNWQWEFYGKLALRNSTTTIARDFTGVSSTNLSQFRVTYRLGYNAELVGETRLLNQPTAGYSELGLVGEVGYYLTPNLRLAAGYSSGSVNVDRDFNGSRSTGGLYAGITVKLNELFDGFGLQKTPARQQQDPVEPVPIVQVPEAAPKIAAEIPPSLQIISLNVARSLTFKPVDPSKPNASQGDGTRLEVSDIAILENLVAVLKEYNNLSVDIQGYIGSLADMNSGDNLAASRMIVARNYLLNRGVASTQMNLRSLSSIANNPEQSSPEKVSPEQSSPDNKKIAAANAIAVSFALSGKADIFNAIATRLQTQSPNSPATKFLQSVLPNITSTIQANVTPANNPNNNSMLLGSELAISNNNPSEPVVDSANSRLATAFNFLLTNDGDTLTAFLRAIRVSTTEKSGFAIDPAQFNQIKN